HAFDFRRQRWEDPLLYPGCCTEFPPPQPGFLITALPCKRPFPDVYPERADAGADECLLARDIAVFLRLDMDVGCYLHFVIVVVGLASLRGTLPPALVCRVRQISCEVAVERLDAERLICRDDRAAEIAVCIRPRLHLAVTYRRHRRKMLFRQVIRPVIAAAVC